ncbi:hypothetical protein [Kribbella deserti]|uniref:Uncharacterized protein n=1 Tax=Kribbella deserti TaxID=1926257 RepID=A0ABV6QEC6_9ACTN
MRARSVAPLLAVVPLLIGVLASCGSGEGLRVEGAGTPVTSPTASPTPDRSIGKAADVRKLSIPALRQVLLTDRRVPTDMKNLVRVCKFPCVKSVAVLTPEKTTPKQAVTISTVTGGAFVVLLIDDLTTSPKVVWQTQGDGLTVSVGKDSTLVVESSVFGQGDKVCCSSGPKVEVYRWSGSGMVKLNQ